MMLFVKLFALRKDLPGLEYYISPSLLSRSRCVDNNHRNVHFTNTNQGPIYTSGSIIVSKRWNKISPLLDERANIVFLNVQLLPLINFHSLKTDGSSIVPLERISPRYVFNSSDDSIVKDAARGTMVIKRRSNRD